MPEAIINGYRMHYEVYGRGQPLVLIHGDSLNPLSSRPPFHDQLNRREMKPS